MSHALAIDASVVGLMPLEPAGRTLDPQQHYGLVNGKLDDDGVANFHQEGFIAVDGIVDAVEIEKLTKIILQLHEKNVGFSEGAQFDAAGADGDPSQRRFPQILNPRLFAPALLSSKYHEVALAMAKQLIGDKARLKVDISFLKPPQIGCDTAWHQDEAFANPSFDHRALTIWLALTEANSVNSCMSYIPGSNKFPILLHRPAGGDPRAHAIECIEGFDPAEAVECPLQPGDCTIHHCRTLHYAGPNASNNFRLAYAMVFDVPPVLREVPHQFPWRALQHTDRAEREKMFRRRGGILIHIWRERRRIGLSVVKHKMRQAVARWTYRKL